MDVCRAFDIFEIVCIVLFVIVCCFLIVAQIITYKDTRYKSKTFNATYMVILIASTLFWFVTFHAYEYIKSMFC